MSDRALLIAWAAFAAIAVTLLWSNTPCMYFGFDGAILQIYAKYQSEFKSLFSWNMSDPMQGMFDLYFPTNFDYFIPNALLGLPRQTTGYVFGAYTIIATLIAGAVYLFARKASCERRVSLLAAILTIVLIFPIFSWKPLSSTFLIEFIQLNPQFGQLLFLCYVSLWCLWSLDPERPTRSIAVLTLLIVSLVLAFLATLPYALLMGATLAVFGFSAIFLNKDRKHRWTIIGAGVVVVCVLVLSGILPYIYIASLHTVYAFFPDEFVQDRPLTFISILYGSKAFYAGPILIAMAVIGGVRSAINDTGRARHFALTFLGMFIAFQAIGYFVAVVLQYKGPSPVYFELFLWPVYTIFSAKFLYEVSDAAFSAIARKTAGKSLVVTASKHMPVALVLAGSIGIGTMNIGATGACPIAMWKPLSPSPITDYLRREIAIAPGRAFRGTEATFTGYQNDEPASWPSLSYQDYQTWLLTGKDHRTVGLWRHNIPTLQTFTSLVSPTYFVLLRSFLSRPMDIHSRTHATMTVPNEKMLALWGVRYLISDHELDIGTERIRIPLNGKPPIFSGTEPLRLVELEMPNLGNYSPTKILLAHDIPTAIKWLKAPSFDGRKTVVSERDPSGGTPLVVARSALMNVEKDGLRIRASSTGTSILVLPVQFSHCWRAQGADKAKIFRANVMQMGILFSGKLDANLRMVFGPGNFMCRMDDVEELKRLDMQGANTRH